MSLRSSSKKRAFRASPTKGYLGMVFLALGFLWLWSLYLGGTGAFLAYLLPLIFLGIGARIFGTGYLRRIETDWSGLSVFDSLNRRTERAAWQEIEFYEFGHVSTFRSGWIIGTTGGQRFKLPKIENPYGLQREILGRINPSGLRTTGQSRPVSFNAPGDEVIEPRYRSWNDYSNLAFSFAGLILSIAGGALLVFLVLQGNSEFGVFGGFAVGLLILVALHFCRTLSSHVRRSWTGRDIEITRQGIALRESGRETTILWRNLRMVEKAYSGVFNEQSSYILLFDGESSIAYRADWRHAETLLHHASKYAPPSTVFAGFD